VYLDYAQKAILHKESKQISDFEKEYKNGERSAAFMKAFIKKRQEALLPTGDLLDEYVGKLQLDSLTNFAAIKFI